jgi:uncharacterized membrane protein (DUF485 family)
MDAQMDASRDNGDELNKQKREFYKSLTIGLLAFMVSFVLLKWVLF